LVIFIEISPGNSLKGILVYDMPKGAKAAQIEPHDSMLSGGVTVTLSPTQVRGGRHTWGYDARLTPDNLTAERRAADHAGRRPCVVSGVAR
jgi:hypothetical protein